VKSSRATADSGSAADADANLCDKQTNTDQSYIATHRLQTGGARAKSASHLKPSNHSAGQRGMGGAIRRWQTFTPSAGTAAGSSGFSSKEEEYRCRVCVKLELIKCANCQMWL